MRHQGKLALALMLGLSACSQVTGPTVGSTPTDGNRSSSEFNSQQLRPRPFRTLPPIVRERGVEPLVAWEFAIERELLRLTNEERARAGLSAVTLDERLQRVARLHSMDQATRNYSAHESPEGKKPADRLRDAGITFTWQGENIRWVSARDPGVVARDMMYEEQYGWMNSPGHRANILNSRFTHAGIGVIKSSTDGRYIATQNFIQSP